MFGPIPFRLFPRTHDSIVPDHEGPCVFTWANKNLIDSRHDGGVSGFLRNVKPTKIPGLYRLYGEEFHGMILFGTNTVFDTEGCYKRWDLINQARRRGVI